MKKSDKNIVSVNKMNNANSGSDAMQYTGNSENFNVPLDIAAKPYRSCPETAEEMVNTYGTYNIQPTANTENDFPAIAQGETKEMKERPFEFFRGPNDPNPAAYMSGEDCI